MLLKKRGIAFEEIDVTHDDAKRAWLVQATGRRTVPQIFIDGESIGGSDELHALDRKGELMRRSAASPTRLSGHARGSRQRVDQARDVPLGDRAERDAQARPSGGHDDEDALLLHARAPSRARRRGTP